MTEVGCLGSKIYTRTAIPENGSCSGGASRQLLHDRNHTRMKNAQSWPLTVHHIFPIAQPHIQRETHTETHTPTHIHTDRQTHPLSYTHTHSHTQTHKHTHTLTHKFSLQRNQEQTKRRLGTVRSIN